MKLAVAFVLTCFLACASTPTSAQDKQVAPQIVIPQNAVDQTCELVLEKSQVHSKGTYTGRILRIDDKSIVIVDSKRICRVESSVPILGDIPYLGRLFRNNGIGTEDIPGELEIDRSRIRSIKFAK